MADTSAVKMTSQFDFSCVKMTKSVLDRSLLYILYEQCNIEWNNSCIIICSEASLLGICYSVLRFKRSRH